MREQGTETYGASHQVYARGDSRPDRLRLRARALSAASPLPPAATRRDSDFKRCRFMNNSVSIISPKNASSLSPSPSSL